MSLVISTIIVTVTSVQLAFSIVITSAPVPSRKPLSIIGAGSHALDALTLTHCCQSDEENCQGKSYHLLVAVQLRGHLVV